MGMGSDDFCTLDTLKKEVRALESRVAQLEQQLAEVQKQSSCPRWNSNLLYYKDKVGVKFESEEDEGKAIELYWNDAYLQGVPRLPCGDMTEIIPAEAAQYLRSKGVQFTEEKVVDPSSLSTEEFLALRRQSPL